MDPKVFRIGNYISTKNTSEVFIITAIEEKIHAVNAKMADALILRPEEIEPIPLSEKWLKSFGFEMTQAEPHRKFIVGQNHKIMNTVEILDAKFYYWLSREDYLVVKYVHQLQNIFFAITEHDLEVKEESLV